MRRLPRQPQPVAGSGCGVTDAQVIAAVACPWCGAYAIDECWTGWFSHLRLPLGRPPTRKPHAARVTAAKRAEEATHDGS